MCRDLLRRAKSKVSGSLFCLKQQFCLSLSNGCFALNLSISRTRVGQMRGRKTSSAFTLRTAESSLVLGRNPHIQKPNCTHLSPLAGRGFQVLHAGPRAEVAGGGGCRDPRLQVLGFTHDLAA